MPAADPIAAVTYAHSGIMALGHALTERYPVAWIQGPNLVQLCDRLARDWQALEGRAPGTPSRLAQTSVRSLVQTMITARLAGDPASRWFTVSVGAPSAAPTFALLYPCGRFIYLHRSCTDMIHSALSACRWGLAGTACGFEPFAAAHAGNPVAALADYWATHTEQMLDFERDHPGRYVRVRYEDLAATPASTLAAVGAFLGLGEPRELGPRAGAQHPVPGGPAVGGGQDIPADRIPAHVLARVNRLHESLGYPPVR
jgi:hypothetical protein